MKITKIIKYSIIFNLIFLLSCNKKENNIKYTYYNNGKIAQKITNLGNKRNNIVNYYESGNMESKGSVLNNKRIGWWTTYKNGKLRNKYNFLIIENKEYFNQLR